MKLIFRTGFEELKELDFIIEELDLSKFDFDFLDEEELKVIKVEEASFRDIFNFIDNLFYSGYSKFYDFLIQDEVVFSLGSTLIFYKKDGDIFIDLVDQRRVKPIDLDINPGGYGLNIDDFNINSGNYFISIKSPGGFFCYQLEGNPYKEIDKELKQKLLEIQNSLSPIEEEELSSEKLLQSCRHINSWHVEEMVKVCRDFRIKESDFFKVIMESSEGQINPSLLKYFLDKILNIRL